MHLPQAGERVRTADGKYGTATGRTDQWDEHYEIDLGDRRVYVHYEEIREADPR